MWFFFREKEKAEIKDRKVLSILSVKDDKIDELQKVIATQSAEVSGILSKYELFRVSTNLSVMSLVDLNS